MNLYCAACDEIHWFKPTEVERIVYALIDKLVADGRAASKWDPTHDFTWKFPCLKDVLDGADDWDEHAVTVQAWVSQRVHA